MTTSTTTMSFKPRRAYVVLEMRLPVVVNGVEILVQHNYILSLN